MDFLSREAEVLDFLQELSANPPQLPYESTLIPMLFKVTQGDSKASIEDLTKLIERSQKLAAKVLSLANSAAFSTGSKVASLQRAVTVLGFNEVRSLVLLAGASAAVEKNRLPVQFDALFMWQHQLLTAFIARVLAKSMNQLSASNKPLIEPDEAYVAGLLHDIGKVFMASYRPEVWQSISDESQREEISYCEAEIAHWGLHHGTVAALVLRGWKLPPLLNDMIEWHHNPEEALTHKREAFLLSAANKIAHVGLSGGQLTEEVIKLLPPDIDHEYIGLQIEEHIESGQYKELAQALF